MSVCVVNSLAEDGLSRRGWAAPGCTPGPDRYYDVERIVRAERLGKGWRVYVKWAGYGDDAITPEPLHGLLKTIKDPNILEQIERCKEEYLAAQPNAPIAESVTIEPTRVLPPRDRASTRRFMFHISQLDDDNAWLVNHGLRLIRHAASERCSTLYAMPADFSQFSSLLAAV